jgi:hypothetical protein
VNGTVVPRFASSEIALVFVTDEISRLLRQKEIEFFLVSDVHFRLARL